LKRRLAKIKRQLQPLALGLIGTLKTRNKGIQTIFKALSLVSQNLPAFEFRILGEGDPAPWRLEAARHGVGDLVVFDGTLPAGEPVLNWLDNVDVYLQPSFHEGLPRALIEAMSRGCPAIASSCGGIPELLEKECLIRPGDAKHLAELLVKAATNREWQDQQAARNWRKSGEYSRDKLEARRTDFLARFAAHAAAVKRARKHI
jgi:glycosyltransferase involved in cell wall biosynthesis